jgi:transcriptional regulator with XRE-family HTH domain
MNRIGIIRAERKAQRLAPWQRDEIARAMGWSPAKLQRIENETIEPTAEDIDELAAFFDVPKARLGLKARKVQASASA